MEAVKRDGKMNWKKVLPVVLWVGLTVFAIGAILLLAIAVPRADLAYKRVLSVICAVLMLLISILIGAYLWLSRDTYPNFFLYDRKKRRNIPVDKLTFKTVNERMTFMLTGIADSPEQLWKGDVLLFENEKFGYKSVMQIPKLDKVIINVAAGEAKENVKVIDAIVADLGQITGQKAVVCKAKKSVANFKLRQGTPIGCKVTLRGERMYEFVDRFFNVALPRVRDFRGINGNGFDGRGNFACGIKEQIIFPEIDFEKVDAVRGMDVCFVTTAKTDEEGKELLKALGAPFAENN